MNLKELREIIDIFTSKESIEELEFEKSGVRLRIKRAAVAGGATVAVVTAPAPASVAPAQYAAAIPPPSSAETVEELYYVKSPIVGTFYKAPSPTAEPFVSIGAFVEKGSVLCIIEAMKLMNEIESDVSGEVVSVLVDNGQPVEYGENLFAIRLR